MVGTWHLRIRWERYEDAAVAVSSFDDTYVRCSGHQLHYLFETRLKPWMFLEVRLLGLCLPCYLS